MVLFLIAFAGSAALTWLCDMLELIPWRRSQGAHWTERARQLYPARVGALLNEWAIPLLAVVVGVRFGYGDAWFALLTGAYLGGFLGGWPLGRAIVPNLTISSWLRLSVVHLVFRSLSWGVFVAAIHFMPPEWNARAAIIGIAFLALKLALKFGLGLWCLRMLGVLKPASAQLAGLVAETSAHTGVPVRATWELIQPQANAFAMIMTGELVFSSLLLETAPDDELRAICRHELAHLSESRAVIAARLLGELALVPLIFVEPVFHRWGTTGIAAFALGCFLVWVLRPRFVQALERRADKHAVDGVPDPTTYARALERIHEINQMPAVLRHKSLNTHPDLYDRMLAANVTPAYPRPALPRAQAWTAQIVVGLVTAAALFWFMPG